MHRAISASKSIKLNLCRAAYLINRYMTVSDVCMTALFMMTLNIFITALNIFITVLYVLLQSSINITQQ